ncbi:RNA-binding motif protein 25 isoform X2 [Cryptomeria japonica]|uniref:RNA-binding motif protein 25 isoform X2 n=1 Tax=Cryptomeria japonica TaxID=3369 RepID=UPI0027DA6D26|nr:RNA-binding motif protein 25 isoform X2 [Cryptomeria japonica]
MSVAMAVSPSSSSLEAAATKQQQEMSGVEPGTSQSQPQVHTMPTPPQASNSNDNSNNNSNSNSNNNNVFAAAATPPPPGLPPYTASQIPPPQVAPVSFYRPVVQTPPPPLHPPGVSSGHALQQQQTPNPNSNLGFGQQAPSGNTNLGFGQQAPSVNTNVGFGQQAPGPNSNMSTNPNLGFGQQPASTITPPAVRPPGLFPVSAPQYQQPRPFGHPPNGFSSAPMPLPGPPGAPSVQQPQMMNPAVLGSAPAGMPRYSAPYPPLVRPTFAPRPPGGMGVMPLPRPPMQGARAMPQVLKYPLPVSGTDPLKGALPLLATAEKPQTTVYVGKIAPSVENDFLLSLLELCGTIKSWKRAQDPTNGTPKGFGFCEFESAEGVLRALRLLNKFCLEGQELVLNVNQATRDYLERYVEKKTEREKQIKAAELQDADKEEETAPGVEKKEPPKPPPVDSQNKDNGDSEDQDSGKKFGIVNDADRQADENAMLKLKTMLEERSRLRPLPPPPPLPTSTDGPGKSVSASEATGRSKDADSDVEIMKSDVADDKNEEDTTSENKPTSEHEKPETSSSDKGRRYDRNRERDRERDLKREKERELERYERERERERLRREREREMRIREAERLYEEREREWEAREREKERQRQYEREREKDRERERRREIKDQEDASDDEDWRKRRHRSSIYEEKRKRRQREREEDLSDQYREEQEIAEAKKHKYEDTRQDMEDTKVLVRVHSDAHESAGMCVDVVKGDQKDSPMEQGYGSESGEENNQAEAASRNGNASISGDEVAMEQTLGTESRQNSSAPIRKLGFGLIGSGKRAAVPSVFHEEDDEDMHKDKKMRPLVPIDYSAEEMQAVSANHSSGTASNLAAAAEFAKRISTLGSKEERVESERERSRKQSDRSGQKERESNRSDDRNRSKEENNDRSRDRDRNREKHHEREHNVEKSRAPENNKLLDVRQLIDTIPKTKEELFAYNIDWAIYDKHNLHERMRPWISKKITEFLGEEEPTLVDFVVLNTKKHESAAHMLELLESILDDEAEMFVLKMWRMLIFEIKKVETGLASKSKA